MSTGRVFSGASTTTSGTTVGDVDARINALAQKRMGAYANVGAANAAYTWPATTSRFDFLSDGTMIQALPGAAGFTVIPTGATPDYKGETATEATRLAMAGLVAGDQLYQQDVMQAFELIRLPSTDPNNWFPISGIGPLVGATSIADGVGGGAPKPLTGQQDHVFHADGTWSQIAPDWVANRAYSAGALVVAENSIFRRTAAGTSGAGWNAAERSSWERIGSAQLGSLTDVTTLPVPQTLAELESFKPAADMPPGTQWISRVFSSAVGGCNQLAMVVGGVWTWVGMTPLAVIDRTPSIVPPSLIALTVQVDPNTRPAWEVWESLVEVDPGEYRTARVFNNAWVFADQAGSSSTAAAIPVGVKVDVTPTPRPTSLANLTALVPPGNQEPGQVWSAILAPTPTTLRQAEIVDGIWQWASTPGGSSSAAAAMTGATSTVIGAAGSVPAPLAGQQDWFVRGDGSWAQVAPDFVPNRPYSTGALTVFGGVLYRRIAAGTSLASFALDSSNWLALGSTSSAGGIAQWTTGTVYAAGDLVLTSDRIYIADGPHTSGATFAGDLGSWREVSRAALTVHLPNASVNPVVPGLPTLAEVQAGIAAFGVATGNLIITYTGTNSAVDPVTHTYWRDPDSLTVFPLHVPSVTAVMTGATAALAGTAGSVPAPPIGTQGLSLHGDGTFKSVLTPWAPLTPYSAGQLIFTNAGIWKRKVAGLSGGGTFNVTEQLSWDLIADLINAPLSFQGGFSAAGGVLPGAGIAQPGYFYVTTVAGTAGGRTFAVGDQLYALVPNAPTGVYAGNWLHVPSGRVAPYMDTFNLVDWALSGTDRILTYPVATHQQGAIPFVWVEALSGVLYDQVETQITLNAVGDVVLTIPDGNEFDGRVSISAGLGGDAGGSGLATGANSAGSLPGTSGSFVAPAAGDNRSVLRGDNTWGVNIPQFEAATFYRVGYCIVESGQIYSRSVAGVSGASFAIDTGNWTVVGGASQYTTPFVIGSWAGAGPVTLSITAATHGMGLNPRIQVSEALGAGAFRLVSIQTDIAANGDVTFTAAAGFDGRLSIF